MKRKQSIEQVRWDLALRYRAQLEADMSARNYFKNAVGKHVAASDTRRKHVAEKQK